MPRIIVTTDAVSSQLRETPVLLSESVHSVHLSTDHAVGQLIERLAWAVRDAEKAETARRAKSARAEQAVVASVAAGHAQSARRAAKVSRSPRRAAVGA
jgi:hypothetical protein